MTVWVIYASFGIIVVLRYFGSFSHRRGECAITAEVIFVYGVGR